MNVLGFLVRKCLLAGAVNLIILRGLTSVTVTEALLIALAITAVSYPLVQVRIYPTWGNAASTVMDLLIIRAVIWGSGRLWVAGYHRGTGLRTRGCVHCFWRVVPA